MPKKEPKPEIAPATCIDHDREKYHIEIELPGVAKDQIELEVGEQSICIKAPREDVVFSSCYHLTHSVNVKKIDAKFDSGLLLVKAPFKSRIGGTKVPVK